MLDSASDRPGFLKNPGLQTGRFKIGEAYDLEKDGVVAPNQADFHPDIEESRTPPNKDRSIFRAEALERYAQNQDRAVFPRLVSPRSFRILWIVAGVFLVAGILVAFWPLIGPLLAGAS